MKIQISKSYSASLMFAFCVSLFLTGCATGGPHLKLDSSLVKDIRRFDSVEYIPLLKLCDRYDLKYDWDTFARTVRIEKRGKSIVLRVGAKRILVNGNESLIEKPVLASNNTIFVPVSFVKDNPIGIIEPAVRPKAAEVGVSKKFTINRIVIDPGHGGKDPGAIGKRFKKEKHLTLAISKRLKGSLEDSGIKVIMTRESDTFVSLPKRVQIANRSGADLFVSVHVNASRTGALKGFECYYLSNAADDNARALEAAENTPLEIDEGAVLGSSKSLKTTLWDMALTENRSESANLASRLCSAVENSRTVENRGVKSARFYVLKGVRMPSVLVEVAYLSNRYEEMKLKDDVFLDKMADVLAKGILAYRREYEKTGGYTNT